MFFAAEEAAVRTPQTDHTRRIHEDNRGIGGDKFNDGRQVYEAAQKPGLHLFFFTQLWVVSFLFPRHQFYVTPRKRN